LFRNLWQRTKIVATTYTWTFVIVMVLNQLLFFGFCLNPICLIAAMPHVLAITVAIGSWLNRANGWGKEPREEATNPKPGKKTLPDRIPKIDSNSNYSEWRSEWEPIVDRTQWIPKGLASQIIRKYPPRKNGNSDTTIIAEHSRFEKALLAEFATDNAKFLAAQEEKLADFFSSVERNPLTEEQMDIEDILKSRFIEHLVHFTQADNLPSIFREGLVSIDDARLRGINVRTNDSDRYDGYLNAISLSISLPNAKMFYKLRMLRPEIDWALLLIDPAVLYEKRCGFCRFNAADRRIPKRSEDALVGAERFAGMFDRSIPSKEIEFLRPCDPTDPQAEVLIFEPVELTRIRSVVFFDEKVLRCYEDVVQEVQKSVDRTFLDSRSFFLNSSVYDYKDQKELAADADLAKIFAELEAEW